MAMSQPRPNVPPTALSLQLNLNVLMISQAASRYRMLMLALRFRKVAKIGITPVVTGQIWVTHNTPPMLTKSV